MIQDNPNLTVRGWSGHNPIRIVIDKNENLSKGFNVFNEEAETLLLNETSPGSICEKLHVANINSVIIEGGSKTLQTFIDENLWDESRVFTGISLFKEGVKAPSFSGNLISEEKIQTDILKIYSND